MDNNYICDLVINDSSPNPEVSNTKFEFYSSEVLKFLTEVCNAQVSNSKVVNSDVYLYGY